MPLPQDDGPMRPTVAKMVHQTLDEMTPTERRIAHILLASYPMVGLETVAAFAERARTSGPSILRFITKVGFKSYAAFQRALREELKERLESPLARYDGVMASDTPLPDDSGRDTLARFGDALAANIRRAFDTLSRDEYEAVIALLTDSKHALHILGGRFSRTTASYLHMYLRELRPIVHLIDGPTSTWPDQRLDVSKHDTLIVYDFRRYQPDVIRFAEQMARQGVTLVLITDIWNSQITAHAHHVLSVPVEVPSAFDSGVAGLAMTEALVAGVVDRLGSRGKRRIERLEKLRTASGEE
ncbi:MurR/RpiR family transcriptional regulator [Billgrantia endophytica]|uniref:RpiR family transcriptional regulator n=1 Tax=Billgrantia endophytica TaxID=2033802 RepID=A0A2N7UAI6_9GAMM|nr:MurR/RpiR family transcriptional regulator [Halomonas endophytica]PMR77415.1 RpiR family transcriptional regulator [Halomonas endophytica]